MATSEVTHTTILLDNSMLEQLNQVDPSGELLENLFSILNDQTKNFYDFSNGLLLQNDYGNLGREAHKLKSSFGSMGLVELQKICKQIELLAKEGNDSTRKERLKELLVIFNQTYSLSMEILKYNLNGFKHEKKTSA
jgi:HPt (histidine-containing phosphotransfer) domain-containing protein